MSMKRFTAALLACTLYLVPCLTPSVAGARYKVLPIDEAAQAPSFKAFRDRLRTEVESRNGPGIVELTHPTLRDSLIDLLTMATVRSHEIEGFSALQGVLRLGGSFSKGRIRVRVKGEPPSREFCAPYVWSEYPAPDRLPPVRGDDDTPWAILGSAVRVRAHPPEDMRVISRLDYDLVYLASADETGGAGADWRFIVTPEGRKGYVSAPLIRDPIDYHACFGEFAGTWLMTALERGTTR